MEGHDETQATQPATQPVARRRNRTLSQMSDHDAADIICVLHSNSTMATAAIRATMLANPEHILQNDDLEGVTEADLKIHQHLERKTREIALRMSSTVKWPRAGFRFGRNPDVCDILLSSNRNDKVVSNVHFSIYVNDQGSLMIQDSSLNGTIVDDECLRSKDRGGKPSSKPATRALKSGSLITIVVGQDKEEVKFTVRMPNRNGYENLYDEKLKDYLMARGINPNFTTVREASFGNQWNGGDRYNFAALLGKGAFATVYKVQSQEEGNLYAAKEVDRRRFLKNGILDIRFDNELQIMRKLQHPNIVNYIGSEEFEHWIYIIMEYVPFGELSKELHARGGSLPEKEVQQITKQILRAVDYLHRQGITHRDIKPDNILIASRDPLVVKLTDFGLSKSVANEETFLKTFCGTLMYCAPEVYPDYAMYAQQSKRRRGLPPSRATPYSSSADMWSLGTVIFQMLTGMAPITGSGENQGAQMLHNIMTHPVDYEPLRHKGVSEIAIDFISALLNRVPSQRPSEQECFEHIWLRDVADVVDYSSVVDADVRLQGKLRDIAELDEDEDDQQTGLEISQLMHHPEVRIADKGVLSPIASPDRPAKKPRMVRAESGIPQEILYPQLPPQPQSPLNAHQQQTSPKLFGEITPSLLKSSGLFGNVGGAGQSPALRGEIPHVRNQLEQVSMNDFAPSKSHPDPSPKVGVQESGASLLGVNAQLDQMHVGTPDDVGTHPPSPKEEKREVQQAAEDSDHRSRTSNGATSRRSSNDDVRRINIDLLKDEDAFAAEQQLREAAREEIARLKAHTFQVPNMSMSHASVMAKTSSVPGNQERTLSVTPAPSIVKSIPQLIPTVSTSKPTLLGRLMPLEGSFDNKHILLTGRSSIWGRGSQCNCKFTNVNDSRIPKLGMKIVFFARGVEEAEREGRDWMRIPHIKTVIATSASRGIHINGQHLSKEAEGGKGALFGKIYTGDIVTIIDSDQPGQSLKYRVEILFGESAQERPQEEFPFVIQKETAHYARHKEQSTKMLSHQRSNGDVAVASTTKEIAVN